MTRSDWIVSSGLMGGWAVLSGCSQRAEVQTKAEVLPADLETMQGAWSAEATDRCCMCAAVFDGYTLRLKYKRTSEDALMKRNISIKSVDMKSKLLLLHNTGGAWNYNLYRTARGEFLELEFFSDVCHAWFPVKMTRS